MWKKKKKMSIEIYMCHTVHSLLAAAAALRKKITHRTDFFSIGCIQWYFLVWMLEVAFTSTRIRAFVACLCCCVDEPCSGDCVCVVDLNLGFERRRSLSGAHMHRVPLEMCAAYALVGFEICTTYVRLS